MTQYRYRIVNVFAESIFGGNPLCVFEDARGLSAEAMQALALQFNLSETTFLLPSSTATAHVRIFTPTFEMAFAIWVENFQEKIVNREFFEVEFS